LSEGRLVILPTETVYGLAADASNARAVAAIYEAKGRPSFNPLIAHVADQAMAERIGRFDDRARRLAEAFWPGPLTLVLPLREGAGLAAAVTAGLDSVAIRVPAPTSIARVAPHAPIHMRSTSTLGGGEPPNSRHGPTGR